jgi:hypothetical protein
MFSGLQIEFQVVTRIMKLARNILTEPRLSEFLFGQLGTFDIARMQFSVQHHQYIKSYFHHAALSLYNG